MQLIPFTTVDIPQLAQLFPHTIPIPIRLWAILDGVMPGRVFVDSPTRPTVACVQEHGDGTTYLGGNVTVEHVAEAITHLRATQPVVICHWPTEPLAAPLPLPPDYVGTAIDFTDRSPAVNLRPLTVLPPAFQLRRIDDVLVPALHGFDYYIAMFGGRERALQNTFGYCVLDGETVVCEAVAGPFTHGIVEIGVGTEAACRRKGLATATCAAVIQECEARGYRAFWNAAAQNTVSVALARRLGFRTEQRFTVYAWSRLA